MITINTRAIDAKRLSCEIAMIYQDSNVESPLWMELALCCCVREPSISMSGRCTSANEMENGRPFFSSVRIIFHMRERVCARRSARSFARSLVHTHRHMNADLWFSISGHAGYLRNIAILLYSSMHTSRCLAHVSATRAHTGGDHPPCGWSLLRAWCKWCDCVRQREWDTHTWWDIWQFTIQ